MVCKKNALTIIGLSTRTQVCQIHGEDLRNSLYWKKHHQKDLCSPVGDWQKFKRQLDQTMCGLKRSPELVKPLRKEKNENGHLRSRNLTMPEGWDLFIPLIGTTKNQKTSSNMRGESGKGMWEPPYPARKCKVTEALRKLERKPQHPIRFQRQNTIAQWKLTSPQGEEWIRLHRKVTKTISQAKDTTRWHITIWCTSSFRCHKRWKFQMQRLDKGMEKSSNKSSVEVCYSGGADRQKQSPKTTPLPWQFRSPGSIHWTRLIRITKWLPQKVLDVIARQPDCAGQAADAVSG